MPTDGAVDPPDGGPPSRVDAGPPPEPGRTCEDAPRLGLNARVERIDPAGATPPPAGACWSGTLGPQLYYRLELPSRTGVEITTRGTNAPVPGLVDRCTPGADRCRFYNSNGSFSPGETERVTYVGNPEAEPRTLFLYTWWVGDEVAPFSLETRSFTLSEHARCEDARTLPAGELVAPSTERGGTYESWDCWYLPESQFYLLTVPPGSAAVELPGSQLLRARAQCTCGGETGEDWLVNLGDAPRTVLIEAAPGEPIGARIAPIGDTGTCDTAPALIVDGPAVSLATYPRALRAEAECSTVSGGVGAPTWFAVDVPAGATVSVTGTLTTPYPVLVAFDGCGGEGCQQAEGRPDGTYVLELTNPSDLPVRRYVLAGDGFPGPATEASGTLQARRVR